MLSEQEIKARTNLEHPDYSQMAQQLLATMQREKVLREALENLRGALPVMLPVSTRVVIEKVIDEALAEPACAIFEAGWQAASAPVEVDIKECGNAAFNSLAQPPIGAEPHVRCSLSQIMRSTQAVITELIRQGVRMRVKG